MSRFLDGINQIFSPVLVAQVFTSTSIICVIAFHTSANAVSKNMLNCELKVCFVLKAVVVLVSSKVTSYKTVCK